MGRRINPIPKMSDSQTERFWDKVDAVPGACWEWTGSLSKTGAYGSVHIGSRTYKAHRVAYAILIGDTDRELDHLCRNRRCVNPDHLQPVTPYENFIRGHNPRAVQARQTRCRKGHEYTPENTIYKRGGRERRCRICYVADYQMRIEQRSQLRAQRRREAA